MTVVDVVKKSYADSQDKKVGIPIVIDNADRAVQFVAPLVNQRVHNLSTDNIERFDGANWRIEFLGRADVVIVPYSAAMTIDASLGSFVTITPNNAVAFTINAPLNPVTGQRLTITIKNASGGALGVATWNAVFKMAAWAQPANIFSRTIQFRFDGVNWVEFSRTAVDIPS